MEWILTYLTNIRDWVPGQDVLCKKLRDNGKLIEFCGRSNKAGFFVVIAIYFGGARRGCVMIPASSDRAGWSLFQKPISMARVSSNNSGGGGQSTGGGQNGKNLSVYGNQQKFRNFEKIGTNLRKNVIHGDPIVNVSVINGRPTWVFNFKLTFANLALKVCKPEGGQHVVTCLGVKDFS